MNTGSKAIIIGQSLVDGEYDWSHWAMHLWPERVVPKCAERRDLAIAHGLEEVFWRRNAEGDWHAREEPARPVEELVEECRSPSVQAARDSLMGGIASAGSKARTRTLLHCEQNMLISSRQRHE